MTAPVDEGKSLLSIIIIGFNSRKHLERCLAGLQRQTYHDFSLLFIDNGSQDDSVDWLRANRVAVTIIENGQNRGFAAAANQGIGLTSTRYVLTLNPDVMLESIYLERLLEVMEADPSAAAATGKLLQFDDDVGKRTDIIDSAGLRCLRNRRIVDRGQGEPNNRLFDCPGPVFGASGAAAVYRRQALDRVRLKRTATTEGFEYFDEDFFMYKEDADLAWRLLLSGWRCLFVPDAIGYHIRGTGIATRISHRQVLRSLGGLSRKQKYLAYKNQRLMQIKNELWGNFWKDCPFILAREMLALGYLMFCEPYLLRSLGRFFRQLPGALRKRRSIMNRKTSNAKQMSIWFQD